MPLRERKLRTRSPSAIKKGLRRGSKELPTSTNAVDDSVTEVSKDSELAMHISSKSRENPEIEMQTKHALYCILIRKQDSAFIPRVALKPKRFSADTSNF
jgi:hypothetical protein